MDSPPPSPPSSPLPPVKAARANKVKPELIEKADRLVQTVDAEAALFAHKEGCEDLVMRDDEGLQHTLVHDTRQTCSSKPRSAPQAAFSGLNHSGILGAPFVPAAAAAFGAGAARPSSRSASHAR